MLIGSIVLAILFFCIGCGWEQSRWVKLQKTQGFKEVDGELYCVKKIDKNDLVG